MSASGHPSRVGGYLREIDEVTGLKVIGAIGIYELHVPEEERAEYYRNPYTYFEQVLEQEDRPVSELHVIHLRTPTPASRLPSRDAGADGGVDGGGDGDTPTPLEPDAQAHAAHLDNSGWI